MPLYSIIFFDRSSQVVEGGVVEVRDIWEALAMANRRLSQRFGRRGRNAIDPRGRVDVLDDRGTPVARIPCADAIAAMT